MRQSIGGYTFDAVTREEANEDLKAALGHHFSQHLRELYRGVKPLKLPVVGGVASGTSLVLAGNCGPQQGYFWRIGRVTVASSGTDTGSVALYAGSDPSYLAPHALVDASLKVGSAYYPAKSGLLLFPGEQLYANVTSVANNAYMLSGVAIEVPAEMIAKIVE